MTAAALALLLRGRIETAMTGIGKSVTDTAQLDAFCLAMAEWILNDVP